MTAVRAHARSAPNELEISLDAKATVAVGEFSRRGQSRVLVKACDHDFQPDAKVTPYGLFLPQQSEMHLTMTTSKVTSDFQVDQLEAFWRTHRSRFAHVDTLVLLLDNGPENHSHRSQWVLRLVQFAQVYGVTLQLAYYPPYHSKYNPVERTWGVLETHWNGALLDTVDTVVRYAQSMTYNGRHPLVSLCRKVYEKGKCLSTRAMKTLEAFLDRDEALPRYFVTIRPPGHSIG